MCSRASPMSHPLTKPSADHKEYDWKIHKVQNRGNIYKKTETWEHWCLYTAHKPTVGAFMFCNVQHIPKEVICR